MMSDLINDADLKAAALAEQGAVLMVPGEDGGNFLVGSWARIDAHRSFWFAAGGTDQSAAHVLEYNDAMIPHRFGVEFWRMGERVAYLTTIEESELDNEDELKVQFADWQKHLDRMRDFINEQLALLTEGN